LPVAFEFQPSYLAEFVDEPLDYALVDVVAPRFVSAVSGFDFDDAFADSLMETSERWPPAEVVDGDHFVLALVEP